MVVADTTPNHQRPMDLWPTPEPLPPRPLTQDPWTVQFGGLKEYEEAGNWQMILRLFRCRGRWFVDLAKHRGGSALADLSSLRDRLKVALDYERLHGEGSLLDLNHPQTIRLKRYMEAKASGKSPLSRAAVYSVKQNEMDDWETFDFSFDFINAAVADD